MRTCRMQYRFFLRNQCILDALSLILTTCPNLIVTCLLVLHILPFRQVTIGIGYTGYSLLPVLCSRTWLYRHSYRKFLCFPFVLYIPLLLFLLFHFILFFASNIHGVYIYKTVYLFIFRYSFYSKSSQSKWKQLKTKK